MKINFLIASILSITTCSAIAAPKIYGEIDASLDYLPENNATKSDRDVWKVNSNSSFLGLKGEEKLTERLSAVYLIEWAFNADGDGTDWSQRDRYVGLKDDKYGTLKVGKNNSPLKKLSSAVDSFNNYVRNTADITSIMPGENRINNTVVYESPKFAVGKEANIEFNALLATGEAQGIKSNQGGVTVDGGGLGDAWSTSITYADPIFLAAIAYDKAIPSNFLGRGFLNATDTHTDIDKVFAAANTLRLTGRIKPIDGLALKALIQKSEVEEAKGNTAGANNIDDSIGWLVGAEYRLPNLEKWNLKAQYSQNSTSFKNDDADYDAKQIMAGVDYSFNKQVKAYGYTAYATFKQADAKDKQPVVGTGLEFKF
ncbi:porin [Acinetobacter sp. NIPH 1852]|uniref:porin n=1 Tax=Acinetobacter sp. NIPH 1852 TaxID=2923428 RepID=UPI001F4A9CB9|nr:porin [Acinetobacter sp. NIPH 1852]MCH7308790.1 porin [Acinetobacter sp. NIPH 1852]